jgi:hypothetical protein
MDAVTEGKFLATIETLTLTVQEVRCDVKTLLSEKAKTEQRLTDGSKRFSDHEDRLRAIEEKTPSGRTVYAMISIGFVVLGLLIAWVKV